MCRASRGTPSPPGGTRDGTEYPRVVGHPHAGLGVPGWHRIPRGSRDSHTSGWAGSRHLVDRRHPRGSSRGSRETQPGVPRDCAPTPGCAFRGDPGVPAHPGLPTHPGAPAPRAPRGTPSRDRGLRVTPQGSPDTRGTPPEPAPTWGQVPSRGGPHGGAAAQALPTRGVMAGAGGAARPLRPRRAAGSSSRRRPGAWHGWARARARVGSARRCPRLRGAEPSPRRALSRGGRSAPRAGPAA